MTLFLFQTEAGKKHTIAMITVTATAVHKFIHIYEIFFSLLPKGFTTKVYM